MSRKQFGRLLRLIGLPDRGGVARRACCSGSLSPRFLFVLGGSGHPVWFSHKETRVRALSTDHVVEAELSSPCIVLSLESLSDSSAVVRLPGLAPGGPVLWACHGHGLEMSHGAIHGRAQWRPPQPLGASTSQCVRARAGPGLAPGWKGARSRPLRLAVCGLTPVQLLLVLLFSSTPSVQPLASSSRNAWKKMANKESRVKDSGEGYCFKVKSRVYLTRKLAFASTCVWTG